MLDIKTCRDHFYDAVQYIAGFSIAVFKYGGHKSSMCFERFFLCLQWFWNTLYKILHQLCGHLPIFYVLHHLSYIVCFIFNYQTPLKLFKCHWLLSSIHIALALIFQICTVLKLQIERKMELQAYEHWIILSQIYIFCCQVRTGSEVNHYQ